MPQEDLRTDAQLVAALCRGDLRAFDLLYARHRAYVAALALRFAGNPDDALDVLQETFSYVARKAAGGRFELTAAMTTFLYPVVKNTAIAIRRKRRREPNVPDELFADLPATPSAAPADARGELAAVLAGLPETHREVILLRFVDDFSLEEIAQALEIPLGTVKSRLHNAIAALREDPRTARYFAPP
jgi:RNA polymerase sigma-70 factor, ECF subfamily